MKVIRIPEHKWACMTDNLKQYLWPYIQRGSNPCTDCEGELKP